MKKNIYNTITYTQYSVTDRAHVEQQHRVWGDRKLTEIGAKRALTRDGIRNATVIAIDTMIDGGN